MGECKTPIAMIPGVRVMPPDIMFVFIEFGLFQMILLRNFLHDQWSRLCSGAPPVVPEPNVGYDLPASMRVILPGSVRLITFKNQIRIHTYSLDKFRATLSSADSTTLVVRV